MKASPAETMTFIVFSFSVILGPVFGLALQRFSGGRPLTPQTFTRPISSGLALSFILMVFLRETGSAARPMPTTLGDRAPPRGEQAMNRTAETGGSHDAKAS